VLGESLVTTAWRVLGLRMQGRPPAMEVAANILNKKPRTNDKGLSSSLGFGHGANLSPKKKIRLLRKFILSLGLGQILWINDLSDGLWIWDLKC
jgi:hypothetical protein